VDGAATPRPLAPSGFLDLTAPSSATCLPALFHAGSAHGVAPFRALLPSPSRTPSPAPRTLMTLEEPGRRPEACASRTTEAVRSTPAGEGRNQHRSERNVPRARNILHSTEAERSIRAPRAPRRQRRNDDEPKPGPTRNTPEDTEAPTGELQASERPATTEVDDRRTERLWKTPRTSSPSGLCSWRGSATSTRRFRPLRSA
jgi:hypothetical protein